LLRDAQVLSIWEGTTNVLSLDALRAIEKSDAFGPFMAEIDELLAGVTLSDLAPAVAQASEAARQVRAFLPAGLAEGRDYQQAGARAFAYSLARVMAAALLLDDAQWNYQADGDSRAIVVARRWCARQLAPLVSADRTWRTESEALARDLPLAERGAAAGSRKS
jgi:hypothetical protein